ncbi:basic amino acid/polyamine antiporter, APA family [Amycolatopsis xylanica]|uniref:Basic amino acid/polyamine antiporter, APA family n=1 Tax=Amycolatopsis xylanica TaxID=589385 RepID=A0A1H3JQY5_9PSEU|nr:APC family permease [Amycolatopsis xylanica]SDY42342.1 basic amino acid/polyamine antiporter, APA family [Amycolatopsis xylanica]
MADTVDAGLRRTITLPQALSISFHQIVGGGVIALTGAAIAITGTGAPVAYLMAALTVILCSIPYAAVGSALPVTGARYSYAARLIGPSAGYLTMLLAVIVTTQLSLMALTAAEYVHALSPSVPVAPFALGLLTLFFVANLFQISFSNRLGLVLAGIMLVAFLAYAITGMKQVRWSAVTEVAPNGVGQLLAAAALLTFATNGGTYVAEMGREMKRPGRDIPLAIIGGTATAAILYFLMALPSVAILPVSETAGQPMTVVAKHILSSGWFAFFVLGGAVVSVIGHINALMMAATRPVLAAIGDGWFPRRAGALNRHGTPYWLLTGLYLIGIAPVIGEFSIEALAGAASIAEIVALAVIITASLRLRKRFPAEEAAAPFRLRPAVHRVLVAIGLGVLAVEAWVLGKQLTTSIAVALLAWLACGLAWWAVRRKRVARLGFEGETQAPAAVAAAARPGPGTAEDAG